MVLKSSMDVLSLNRSALLPPFNVVLWELIIFTLLLLSIMDLDITEQQNGARDEKLHVKVKRKDGGGLLVEQVGTRVAALLAAVAALHLDQQESPTTSGGRGHSHLAFDVQKMHGLAPAPGRRPRRRRRTDRGRGVR